jgi:hypothetical protein
VLTARDTVSESRLILPDFDAPEDLELIRERARKGELVCPACARLLWLKAGEIRIPHFAHRSRTHCAFADATQAVLAARRLIYRFFQDRIQSGKLTGPLELEPHLPDLPAKPSIDLLLRRGSEKPVAIVILASGLQPEARWAAIQGFARAGFLFRPVFLVERLHRDPYVRDLYILDTAQRDLWHQSPYGAADFYGGTAHSLHFIDINAEELVTLRGLRSLSPPQEFGATLQRTAISQLLWSERHAEWVHPGEAEALKAARIKQKSRPPAYWEPPPPPSTMPSEPAYLKRRLLCVGCHQRTMDWVAAQPSGDTCICRQCSAAGVSLPAGTPPQQQ